jgi:glycine/D-amino acid oxidase-like deaminating enzyme
LDARPEHGAIVIGGGIFGAALAAELRRRDGRPVTLLEAGPELLGRASYVNQARVHNGYHYPRSILTGLRSRVNFPRFVAEFADCIADDFEACYAIARRFSNVTARQFQLFCDRIEAPCRRAPARVRALFSPDYVEEVFAVREHAFDAARLRARLEERLAETGVEVLLGTEAVRVEADGGGDDALAVECLRGDETLRLRGERVFNCTYSRLNRILRASRLASIPLKHELTEMALVEVPEPIRDLAITVMCGPFFSLMPFPARGLHSLSHVRYTPHRHWYDRPGEAWRDPDERLAARPPSNFVRMVRDARRYVPTIAGCRHVDSLWEIKTVLPSAERDDSRPILFTPDPDLPKLVSVMGGKVDNVYDVLEYEAAGPRARVA